MLELDSLHLYSFSLGRLSLSSEGSVGGAGFQDALWSLESFFDAKLYFLLLIFVQ